MSVLGRLLEDGSRTDMTLEERAEEIILEHLLDHVHDEIPYTTTIEVKYVAAANGWIAHPVPLWLSCSVCFSVPSEKSCHSATTN